MSVDLGVLSVEDQNRLKALLEEKKRRERFGLIREFEPYPWQVELANASRHYGQLLAMCANQIGKDQPVSEPVLTPTGWKPIGSIKPGDQVIGSDGTPIVVLGVYPQGQRDIYRLYFTDGSTVRCGKDHMWTVKKHRRWETISVGQMLENFKPAIIPARPVCFQEHQALPVPPYLLGLLLGDGGLSASSVVISSADEEILDYCRGVAPGFGCELKHKSRYDYQFSSKERTAQGHGSNRLHDALAGLGVMGHKSYTKSVPAMYKSAPADDRMALLQGLMDSDGTASKTGARLFCSVSEQLASDVADLARSLGIPASVKLKHRASGDSFEVNLYKARESVFRLSRKKERELTGDARNMRLVKIENLGYQEESVCIEVGATDGLYVTNDYILTHNTTGGAYIVACHLTGLYPDWWEGHRFKKPIQGWACGVSNETTRDILQFNLLGPPGYKAEEGTMFIPQDCIVSTVRKPQVPNAVQTVYVKHYNVEGKEDGVSRLDFKAYEQGEEKFMGRPMDLIWLDEQPSPGIYTQCITRTVATNGIVMMTFTPEDGMTATIHQFMYDRQPGQFLLRATWDDAPHLNEERKKQLLSQYSPHEAKMRSQGIPVYGKGLVFPIPDEDIICDPFQIPDHWPRIAGIDFGWDHPTAVVWGAWDRDTDTFYVYHEYKQSLQTPQAMSPLIRKITPWIPVVWPHDGNKANPSSQGAPTTADLYRKEGLKMTPDHFRNPPGPGEKGKGNIKREPGLTAMFQAMEGGRFKVFSTCTEWFKEKQMYYRDDSGQVVDEGDDLMSATRYAYQSRGMYAATQPEADSYSKYSGQSLPVRDKGVL